MMKNKNVPVLRFSGFGGEWKIYKLAEVSEKIQDGTHFSPTVLEEGEYKYITSKNIRNGFLKLDTVEYISKEDHEGIYKRCDVKFGDVLLTKDGASTGNVCINSLTEEFSLLSSVAFLRANPNLVTSDFLFQSILSPRGQKEIRISISGQAITRITLTKIRGYKLHFPTLPEQQKIATFLTAIDTKIQQLTKKKALLEAYKKGVMQQIFKQEIRFRDEEGEEFGEWEIAKLEEIAERVKRKNKENNQNVITISAQHGLINQQEFFNKSVSAKDVTGYYLLHKDEFAYNKSYSKGYPMGAIKRLKRYEKGVLSTLYICFKIKITNSKGFFEQYFESGFFNKELHKIAQEGARNHGLLNMSVIEFFNSTKIPKPSLKEQNIIAIFLTHLDEKIEQLSIQVEGAQTFKKGLLQKMFV